MKFFGGNFKKVIFGGNLKKVIFGGNFKKVIFAAILGEKGAAAWKPNYVIEKGLYDIQHNDI